ncbi:beta-ketoacyl-ACP synthase II [Vallicoccus soli]|uniref:3-oxoacyl-[acyl-carrier-protein] synthase 2 n=1 Tax=Vallicoccus soli TaxID=2339232 RepID=A0A3A3ZLG0_9ACTN|nr:beta-ketoacyl-ACP synthase II [Vallicoccus soli]RJK96992.1 beta-ketoacyl-[acyl-carrier-protein] synthase II [Vallicoccus soli]
MSGADQRTTVVVTGLGATTPLGGDVASTWSALLEGRSGVRTLPYPWVEEHQLPVRIAATIAVEPAEVLSKPETKRWDRSAQFALVAAREAWKDAGAPEVDGDRIGVAVASGIGGVTTLLDAYDRLKARGPRGVLPLTVPMLMGNSPAAAIGLEVEARAGVHTPVSACASGAEAIAYGTEMIRSGRADVVIAGGTEACIHVLPLAAFNSMQALSTRNDEPARASRPYDKGRDGFVMGEGAGVVVLESEAHARARGATVYAEVLGAGMTSDAHHIAAPEPDGKGASRAMLAALQDAGVTPSDIAHVNAHATSTPVGDIAEALAIRAAFGDRGREIPVTSTKSMTGHLLGAAGAVESIACILAMRHGTIPPTINVDDPDDHIGLDVVANEPRPIGEGVSLNNSFGFGGHNVALVLRADRAS